MLKSDRLLGPSFIDLPVRDDHACFRPSHILDKNGPTVSPRPLLACDRNSLVDDGAIEHYRFSPARAWNSSTTF